MPQAERAKQNPPFVHVNIEFVVILLAWEQTTSGIEQKHLTAVENPQKRKGGVGMLRHDWSGPHSDTRL